MQSGSVSKAKAAVGPVLEVELDDFHPRQVQRIFQGAHVVGNDAQVFGDEAEPADFLIDRPEEVEAGAFFPGAALSRFRTGRHRPVGSKAAEMVDPDSSTRSIMRRKRSVHHW